MRDMGGRRTEDRMAGGRGRVVWGWWAVGLARCTFPFLEIDEVVRAWKQNVSVPCA